jgi:hypothetical protein
LKAQLECAIDTTVLQKSNAPLTMAPGEQSRFRNRLDLLKRIQSRSIGVLISNQLLAEYQKQVRCPRNDYVRAFFELLSRQNSCGVVKNYARFSRADKEKAGRCRYPKEDIHVLRTAIRPGRNTVIYSEEYAMIAADKCIYRRFRVRIEDPCG